MRGPSFRARDNCVASCFVAVSSVVATAVQTFTFSPSLPIPFLDISVWMVMLGVELH